MGIGGSQVKSNAPGVEGMDTNSFKDLNRGSLRQVSTGFGPFTLSHRQGAVQEREV